MAKKKVILGSVLKTKSDGGKTSYLKIKGDHVLKDGQIFNLESPQAELESARKANQDGRLSDETLEKIEERISKTPDFVRFTISTLVEQA